MNGVIFGDIHDCSDYILVTFPSQWAALALLLLSIDLLPKKNHIN